MKSKPASVVGKITGTAALQDWTLSLVPDHVEGVIYRLENAFWAAVK